MSKKSKREPLFSVEAKSDEQKQVLKAISENQLTIITGMAGTGKTHLATLYGMSEIVRSKYYKLILTRPCIEANGERMGYLPGDINEKIAPYLMPIMNILEENMTVDYINSLIKNKVIQPIPFAFLRGLTFRNSFVVADEIQNATIEQVRLLLTRIGENSKVVVTGDLSQSDRGISNGLSDAVERLQGVPNVAIVKLTKESVIRSKLVADIEDRYANR